MKLPPHKLRHGEACWKTLTPNLERGSEIKIKVKYFTFSVAVV